MIPPPRNVLVSYHYFARYDLDRLAGLRIIGDSGAFSAHNQGATIRVGDLADWAIQWRHRLAWVAALDVIGDPEATRRNWHQMVDGYGVPAVPTVHYPAPAQAVDYYAERGVDFLGLGGLVGKPAQSQMAWMVHVLRYARRAWPHLRFHGWGVSRPEVLQLPLYSVDSSGWGAGYRYGRLDVRDPRTGKSTPIQLDGRASFTPEVARRLRDHYGVSPAEVARSGPHNRKMMVQLSALSASCIEQRFRQIHRRNPVTAPKWGQLSPPDGPHLHLAERSSEHLEFVAALNTHTTKDPT